MQKIVWKNFVKAWIWGMKMSKKIKNLDYEPTESMEWYFHYC